MDSRLGGFVLFLLAVAGITFLWIGYGSVWLMAIGFILLAICAGLIRRVVG